MIDQGWNLKLDYTCHLNDLNQPMNTMEIGTFLLVFHFKDSLKLKLL